ncbi:hypothetical protein Avbf_04660 [Armadillidium vulgare]|nr:hypothetical protein Avbf_04660 [Armadillidium vulgare]
MILIQNNSMAIFQKFVMSVCKLLRHIATTEALQVAAKYGEINLRIYGPQVITAAQTLCHYPTSKIAKDNIEVFADMWLNLVGDVKSLTKDISDQILQDKKPQENKQVYMSLPRPGKHGTTPKAPKPTKLDQEEQAKLAKSGLGHEDDLIRRLIKKQRSGKKG